MKEQPDEASGHETIWLISEENPEGERRRVSREELARSRGLILLMSDEYPDGEPGGIVQVNEECLKRLKSALPKKAILIWVIAHVVFLLAIYFEGLVKDIPVSAWVVMEVAITVVCVLLVLLPQTGLRNWWILVRKTALVYSRGREQRIILFEPGDPLVIRKSSSGRRWVLNAANGSICTRIQLEVEAFPELDRFLTKSFDIMGSADCLDLRQLT